MDEKIKQYLEGKLPNEEQQELLEWLGKENNKHEYSRIKQEWWIEKSANTGYGRESLGQYLLNLRIKEKQRSGKTARLFGFYKYAATLLMAVTLTGTLLLYYLNITNASAITEVFADAGQVAGINMPDGSKIWLNSGSTLRYNNRYGISNREMEITGEAFFSMTTNPKIPGKVKAGALIVEVTGTRFCVSNYDNSCTIDVVLQEGSVNILTDSSELVTSLLPGEMASFGKTSKTFAQKKVNPVNYTMWKEGIIDVYELPLGELVRKLERKFNLKFEVSPEVKDLPFTLSIEGESLREVLDMLEKISPVKAIQHGDAIIITKK